MMNKKIYKRALTLAVPMMIQNGITNMVSLVDNVMVGSLGTEAMTGVSIVGQLFFVLSLAVDYPGRESMEPSTTGKVIWRECATPSGSNCGSVLFALF